MSKPTGDKNNRPGPRRERLYAFSGDEKNIFREGAEFEANGLEASVMTYGVHLEQQRAAGAVGLPPQPAAENREAPRPVVAGAAALPAQDAANNMQNPQRQ